jgi:hypothetical protein
MCIIYSDVHGMEIVVGGMKMRGTTINGKFKGCAQCGAMNHDIRSCPLRPGAGLPYFDPNAADPFALRDNLDAKPTPEVLVRFLCACNVGSCSVLSSVLLNTLH